MSERGRPPWRAGEPQRPLAGGLLAEPRSASGNGDRPSGPQTSALRGRDALDRHEPGLHPAQPSRDCSSARPPTIRHGEPLRSTRTSRGDHEATRSLPAGRRRAHTRLRLDSIGLLSDAHRLNTESGRRDTRAICADGVGKRGDQHTSVSTRCAMVACGMATCGNAWHNDPASSLSRQTMQLVHQPIADLSCSISMAPLQVGPCSACSRKTALCRETPLQDLKPLWLKGL